MGKKNGRGRAYTIAKIKRREYQKEIDWKDLVLGLILGKAWQSIYERNNKEG